MYQVIHASRSEFVPVRDLRYHVRVWDMPHGAPAKAGPIFLLHGWMDVAASFQFMVDALSAAFKQGRTLVAPDWRGFGHTSVKPTDCFWFPDYLADLDSLINHYSPEAKVDLIGHSMGGNVTMLYAGVRPERVRRLINLEGFGMPATTPSEAPTRYARWMDEMAALRRGELSFKAYDSPDAVAQRLIKTNPRLSDDKAQWLAHHWSQERAPGQWDILGEAAHKVTNAQLYRLDEVLACYARIACPTLAVHAQHHSMQAWWGERYTLAMHHERLSVIPQLEIACVNGAGHMLHHDQPQAVAWLVEAFLE